MDRYDFVVIGSGPAGQKGAIQAAKLGKRVLVVDKRSHVGGGSVHTGTIPSKTLREAVLYLTGWNQRGVYGYGYRLKPRVTIEDLMQRMAITIEHEIQVMDHQLSRNNIDILHGVASFAGPHLLTVNIPDGEQKEIEAEKFLLATGTIPMRPAHIPFDDEVVVDSDGILSLKSIPQSLVVVGGGVVGAEYASILSVLNVEVTLVDKRTALLDFLDREIVDEFVHALRDRGVVLRLGEQVESVERHARGHVLTRLASGKRLRSDLVLFAAGRIGSADELAIEQAGLSSDEKKRIKVNDRYQTDVPHIYAAGDVIGFPSLASTSMQQGRLAARHAWGQPVDRDELQFPFGIYGVPEMSVVGKTEEELTKENIPYEAGVARLWETARGQIMGLRGGFLKILFGLDDHRVLGVHILGEGSTELIHIGQAVLGLGGTIEYFLKNVFNYPTLAEAYKMAALDAWNRMGD